MRSVVTFRPITSADEPFLYEVYSSTREEELAQTGWPESDKQAFLKMQFSAQQRYYQEHFQKASFQIVLYKGQPAGRLYIDRNDKEIRLIDVALLAKYRNKGIGTGLLQDLLFEATQTRKPIRIHVEKFNPAFCFKS